MIMVIITDRGLVVIKNMKKIVIICFPVVLDFGVLNLSNLLCDLFYSVF